MERVVQTDPLRTALQPVGRVSSLWLACYPIFQDELRYGETTFGTLPEYTKLSALRRTTIDVAERAIASKILDQVGASFIELDTRSIDETVQTYLATRADCGNLHIEGLSLKDLAAQIPTMHHPLFERPPCVLRPGEGIFLDGWMRFFSYRARGDLTIPLLAIDWPSFHDRLSLLDC